MHIYMSYIITVYIYTCIYIYIIDVWYAGSAGCGMHDLAMLTCTSFVTFHGHRVNLSAGLDSLPARTVELGDLNGTHDLIAT